MHYKMMEDSRRYSRGNERKPKLYLFFRTKVSIISLPNLYSRRLHPFPERAPLIEVRIKGIIVHTLPFCLVSWVCLFSYEGCTEFNVLPAM